MTVRGRSLPALAIVAAGAWSCAQHPAADVAHADTVSAAAPVLPLYETAPVAGAETVVGWTAPGGGPFQVTSRTGSDAHLFRRIGTKTFALPLRTPPGTLTQYPCTSCHQGSRTDRSDGTTRHENIKPTHPTLAQGACATCHVPGAVDRLALPGGERGTLNHPYGLCAQCHFRQVESWAASAHGKRLDGWGGPRVVMNCTDCHDPHTPNTAVRIPFPGPQLSRPGGGIH